MQFFENILKGFFGQQEDPDLARFSGASVLQGLEDQLPQLANQNLAYQRSLAVPMEKLAREVEDVYDPLQGTLREKTTKSILDELGLGGGLPQDVQDMILQGSLQTGASTGLGGSQAGRNLVARDLGLSSLDLLNQRIGRAASYTRSAPRPFQERSFVTPGGLAEAGISGTRAANEADIYSSGIKSENNQAIIKALGNLAGYIAAGAMGGPGASLGGMGFGNQIPMGGMTGIPASMG